MANLEKVIIGYPFQIPLFGCYRSSDIQELRGRDLTGTARDLYQGSDGQSLDGDLIELGYYKLSDNSANTSNTNLFKGTWTPLTTKTTIGHNYYFDSSNNAGSTAGQFHFSTKFSSGTGNDTTDDTANTNNELNNAYEITNDTFSLSDDEITRLNAGNDAVNQLRQTWHKVLRNWRQSFGIWRWTYQGRYAHGTTTYNTIMLDGSVDAGNGKILRQVSIPEVTSTFNYITTGSAGP